MHTNQTEAERAKAEIRARAKALEDFADAIKPSVVANPLPPPVAPLEPAEVMANRALIARIRKVTGANLTASDPMQIASDRILYRMKARAEEEIEAWRTLIEREQLIARATEAKAQEKPVRKLPRTFDDHTDVMLVCPGSHNFMRIETDDAIIELGRIVFVARKEWPALRSVIDARREELTGAGWVSLAPYDRIVAVAFEDEDRWSVFAIEKALDRHLTVDNLIEACADSRVLLRWELANDKLAPRIEARFDILSRRNTSTNARKSARKYWESIADSESEVTPPIAKSEEANGGSPC